MSDGGGGLLVVGGDAETPIIPDQSCRIVFSKILWVQDGLHHGRPCYKGVDIVEATNALAASASPSSGSASTMLVLACGVAIGMAAMLAAQRWRGA